MIRTANDIQLATAYRFYADARFTADRLHDEDDTWIYNVRQRQDGRYVIEVCDDELFLGYL